MLQMLNNFYTDVKYFPNRGLDSFIYSNSRLAENYDIYESDDLVVAKLNNKYTIKLADILAKKRENDSDGGTTTVTVFEGLFMTFKIDSSINCNFKIVTKINTISFPTFAVSSTGCYQGWQELRNYRKFASLTVTCEDAKAYMYSLSSKRRVHKWTDIQVNLYI